MVPFIDSLYLLISALIAVIILGLIAGFSPTLYIAQVSIAEKKSRILPYTVGLMSGVLGAILLLIVLFQFFQLDTLVSLIDSTITALFLSAGFNILVGTGLIFGGFWYIQTRNTPAKKPVDEANDAARTSGISAIVTLGFLRTLTSMSGLTATFIASGVIGSTTLLLLERLIITVAFLAATIVPFVAIIVILKRNPKKLVTLTNSIKLTMGKFNYRMVAGIAAVILGSAIIIFNLTMALFY